jgi:hypothetical protein
MILLIIFVSCIAAIIPIVWFADGHFQDWWDRRRGVFIIYLTEPFRKG